MSIRIEEEQVRDALQQVTAPIRPVSTLLPEVRHRIRRITIRRRIAQAGTTLAIVVAAVSAFTLHTAGHGSPVTEASSDPGQVTDSYLMNRPTGGDLRGDQRLIATVMTTWEQYGGVRDLAGPRHLAWVGNTPVGQAAIGVQPAAATGFAFDVTYFVAEQGAAVKVAASGLLDAAGPTLGGVMLGADKQVLLSLDTGPGMEYSTSRTIDPDGHISRKYQPVPYTDGAAVIKLQSRSQANQFQLRRVGVSTYEQQVYVANLPPRPYRGTDSRTLWGGDLPLTREPDTPTPEAGTRLYTEQRQRFNDALYEAGYAEELPGGESDWYAYGTLPDGTEVIAGEYQVDAVSRTYAVLYKEGSVPRVVFGQRVDRSAALQVCIKLPDRLGWVAVQVGAALTWPGGSAMHAALLPYGTPAVTVRADGAAPQQVPLTR